MIVSPSGRFACPAEALLGRPGRDGEVYGGMDRETGLPCALKRMFPSRSIAWQSSPEARVLIDLSRKPCSAPTLMAPLAIESDSERVWIAMPRLDCDMMDRVRSAPASSTPLTAFSEEEAALVTLDVVEALVYLHDTMDIAHCDIKLDNILWDSPNQRAVLSDFGLCRRASAPVVSYRPRPLPDSTKVCFYAPEMFSRTSYDPRAFDVWGVGACLVSMLTRSGLAYVVDPRSPGGFRCQPPRILQGTVSDDCFDFLNACLGLDPARRSSAAALLAHPWLRTAIRARTARHEAAVAAATDDDKELLASTRDDPQLQRRPSPLTPEASMTDDHQHQHQHHQAEFTSPPPTVQRDCRPAPDSVMADRRAGSGSAARDEDSDLHGVGTPGTESTSEGQADVSMTDAAPTAAAAAAEPVDVASLRIGVRSDHSMRQRSPSQSGSGADHDQVTHLHDDEEEEEEEDAVIVVDDLSDDEEDMEEDASPSLTEAVGIVDCDLPVSESSDIIPLDEEEDGPPVPTAELSSITREVIRAAPMRSNASCSPRQRSAGPSFNSARPSMASRRSSRRRTLATQASSEGAVGFTRRPKMLITSPKRRSSVDLESPLISCPE